MTKKSSQKIVGAEYIRAFAARLPELPGVYRMLGAKGEALYVGKAKSLKKRVMSYATRGAQEARIMRMVMQTANMEVITTRSEAEALLVEANLIKKLKPAYNILYRDDKSYPYILITGDHAFPQIVKHRGAQKRKGRYFGPFASVGAVNETLSILQKVFLLRPCADNVFAQRARPCLQYQIKRCSAPCVRYIGEEDYGKLVEQAENFLSGKSREIQEQFAVAMQAASERQDYEKAAQYRDRIRALTKVQQEHGYITSSLADADIVVLCREQGHVCVQVFFFRAGQAFGDRAFFPANTAEKSDGEILEAFLGQFYQDHPPPRDILLSHAPENMPLLEEALTLHAGRKVTLAVPKRGDKQGTMERALDNARRRLALHLAERLSERKHLAAVAELFALPEAPRRIEVYDNSHISGTHAVGAMIVAGPEGFDKKSYRRFTIRRTELAANTMNSSPLEGEQTSRRRVVGGKKNNDTTPHASTSVANAPSPQPLPLKGGAVKGGDDYAMLREMLMRRFSRLQKEDPDRARGHWPDLVLIDGGAGQVGITKEVMEELGVADIPFAGIAKGPDRNAGNEQFFLPGKSPFRLPKDTPVLHYLQRLRDEAHRFAVASHRIKRANALRVSELDSIEGVGPTRKKALLHHFGSRQGVESASLQELMAVPGINKKTALLIYNHFHG